MSRIGILQPVYLPWVGYFEQIIKTDTFVFLDDVQYTKQDWRNRNQIKTPNGPIWLTIPVRKMPLKTSINNIPINYDNNWVSKHLKSVQVNYSKAAYFDPVYSIFEEVLVKQPYLLADCTIELIENFCKYMNIETKLIRSSDIPQKDNIGRNQRLIEIAKSQMMDQIYLGKSSANYASPEKYENEGITISFQNYQHPVYPQLYGDFLSNMGIIDLLMNVGRKAKDILSNTSRT